MRRSCAASAPTRIPPPASGPRRRGSPSSASGCSTTSRPTGSCSPTSRSCSSSCSSPSGCARVIRSLLSLVPVLIAVGISSLVAYAFSLELSPMTAVGGPLVVAACTEFTSLILLRFVEERRRGLHAAGGGRRRRVAHRPRLHRLRPHRHRRRRRARRSRRCRCCATSAASSRMNVAVALLSALVVLPPMLVWAGQAQLGVARSHRQGTGALHPDATVGWGWGRGGGRARRDLTYPATTHLDGESTTWPTSW